MADHDELCEKADVGSLCDCSCAGAKHAIRHTKGAVPGAGAVSRRAQKAAAGSGRAAVINNRAQPKEGSRVAPSAPSSFKNATPDAEPAGKNKSTGRARLIELKPGAVQLSGQTPEVGTRVVHERMGPGTIAVKGAAGARAVVDFDSPLWGRHTVERHELFDAEDVTGYAGKPVPATAPGRAGPGYTPEQAANRDAARNARLDSSIGRRARVEELSPLSREQFDALPETERTRALQDLRRITQAGDTRTVRGMHGIATKVDQRHIGRADDLLRRFTAQVKPPAPAKAGPVSRFDALTDTRQIDDLLKGMNREELVELGEAKGWVTKAEADKAKLFYLRKLVADKAHPAMRARQDKATPQMTVTSRRRNGDTVTHTVAKPAARTR